MKRILLASASIVAFAGAASAEITFNGEASLGYNDTEAESDGTTGGDEDRGFYWDAELGITMSQELDNGLVAAATVGLLADLPPLVALVLSAGGAGIVVAARAVGAIGANAVTRHDAPASVRAGFHGAELSRLWPGEVGFEGRRGPFTHGFAAQGLRHDP